MCRPIREEYNGQENEYKITNHIHSDFLLFFRQISSYYCVNNLTNNIYSDIFFCFSDTFHHSTPLTSVHNSPHAPLSPTTTKTKSSEVQSIQTKKKHSSLKKSKTDLDDTILVSTTEKGKSDSIKENSQPMTPLNQSVKSNSDSQISITSSINAEFNNSYSKSTVDNKSKHSHSKTRSSDTKSSSKNKSCKKTESQSITDKTEAEANKNLFHKKLISTPTVKNRLKPKTETKTAVTTCTYVPVRHNLPLIITQSNIQNTYCPKSTAPIMSPGPYTSTSMTPANINQTPNRSQNLFYFGSKE